MKKYHLLLTLATIANTLSAQDWSTTGNLGTTPAINFVGTTDNSGLAFRTNSTERMRLTPTGELGVGTSTPASLLHLTSTTSGNIFRTDGPAGSLNQWQLFTGGTEKFRLSVAASSSHVNLNVVQNANMLFSTNNTQRMTILGSNGWVGIGSTNPISVLHINKSNTGEMFRTVGADTTENRWRLFTNGNAVVEKFRLFVPKDTTNVFLQAQRATGNLSFNTAGGVANLVPDTKLRIFPDFGIS